MECKDCKQPLTEQNWTLNNRDTHRRIFRCDDCHRIRYRQWQKTPAGRVTQKRHVLWARKHYIGVRSGNKHSYVRIENKRDHTAQCEMCDRSDKRLVYHHWDDSDYSLGIWICVSCHNTAHAVEKDLDLTYRALKAKMGRKVA